MTAIKLELERATARRAELLHLLSERHDPALAAEHQRLERKIARLWDDHRAARAEIRFGERQQIITRARHEERLERAA